MLWQKAAHGDEMMPGAEPGLAEIADPDMTLERTVVEDGLKPGGPGLLGVERAASSRASADDENPVLLIGTEGISTHPLRVYGMPGHRRHVHQHGSGDAHLAPAVRRLAKEDAPKCKH